MSRNQFACIVIAGVLACCVCGCGSGKEPPPTDQPRQPAYLTLSIRWPGAESDTVHTAAIPDETQSIQVVVNWEGTHYWTFTINRPDPWEKRLELFVGEVEVIASAYSEADAGGDLLAEGRTSQELLPYLDNVVRVVLEPVGAPDQPEELTTRATESQVRLTWKAPTWESEAPEGEIPVGYNVYRSGGEGLPFEPLHTAPVETNTSPGAEHEFVDTSPTTGVTHRYHVRAVNRWGAESEPSNERWALAYYRQEMIGPDGGVMVWVPPGEFRRRDGYYGYGPEHRVRITRGFWMAKHEVTKAQYAAFLNAYAPGNDQPTDAAGNDIRSRCSSRISPDKLAKVYDSFTDSDGRRRWVFSHWEPFEGGADHPVQWVNWYCATAYAAYYGLRLPTEAEWEYAAGGPEERIYPWGDEWDGSKLCWNANRGPNGTTFPVGSFPAGAAWCGALDMAGNAWEWCADWWYYGDGFHGRYPTESPQDDPTGPATGTQKVLRGGHFGNYGRRPFRCDYAWKHTPSYRLGTFGFRCAQ